MRSTFAHSAAREWDALFVMAAQRASTVCNTSPYWVLAEEPSTGELDAGESMWKN